MVLYLYIVQVFYPQHAPSQLRVAKYTKRGPRPDLNVYLVTFHRALQIGFEFSLVIQPRNSDTHTTSHKTQQKTQFS